VDTTDSIVFTRKCLEEMLSVIFLVPLGVLCLIGSPIAFVTLIQEGHHPLALAASAILAFAPLMLFGWGMVMITLFVDRKLAVSREAIRVHRWIGGNRTIDISALEHIVLYGNPAQLFFLPNVGRPLLTVHPEDFPVEMPAAIGEHLRMPVERLGDVDIDQLRKKYPHNDWSGVTRRQSS
jgi:hypothetical protein